MRKKQKTASRVYMDKGDGLNRGRSYDEYMEEASARRKGYDRYKKLQTGEWRPKKIEYS